MKSVIFPEIDIQALQDNQKNMFRIPVKPQWYELPFSNAEWSPDWQQRAFKDGPDYLHVPFTINGIEDGFARIYPLYLPGEVIYVKEKFGLISLRSGNSIIGRPSPKGDEWNHFQIVYKASMSDFEESFNYKWFSPIYLPERFSRFRLKILTARAEPVQEITEENAVRKGFNAVEFGRYKFQDTKLAKSYFIQYWDTRYAHKPEYQWQKNPWTWVHRIERMKGER